MITRNPEADGKAEFNHYPRFALRQWHGLSTTSWWNLLATNKFRVDRPGLAAGVTVFALMNSIGNRIQQLFYEPRAKATPMAGDPVFVLGHWRTGTTLLHSLLSLDDRFAAPSNYDCFTPKHFLFTGWWFPNLVQLPQKRPMDNMTMNWSDPQEEEQAICSCGLPSVYRNVAFPKHEKKHIETLDMEGLPTHDSEQLCRAMKDFVTSLNYKYRRPLILKSPTNTGRIHKLLTMFPTAKFVHITRDPFEFIPSTIHLWNALSSTNGLQSSNQKSNCEDYVFECFHRMYNGYRRHRDRISNDRFHEVRYEELTADPLGNLRETYRHLDLPDFQHVEPAINKYIKEKRSYKRNEHMLSAELTDRISSECREYMNCFGYNKPQRQMAA